MAGREFVGALHAPLGQIQAEPYIVVVHRTPFLGTEGAKAYSMNDTDTSSNTHERGRRDGRPIFERKIAKIRATEARRAERAKKGRTKR